MHAQVLVTNYGSSAIAAGKIKLLFELAPHLSIQGKTGSFALPITTSLAALGTRLESFTIQVASDAQKGK